MGVDQYIIKGKVIGKERVSQFDPWNLKIKVEEWREIDLLKDLVVKFVFTGKLIGLLIFYLRNREKQYTPHAEIQN